MAQNRNNEWRPRKRE